MSMLTAMQAVATASGGSSSAAGAFGPLSLDSKQSTPATPFGDLMTDAVGQVTSLENQARTAVDGLMTGAGVDVHEAMIAGQKASMAFELALAVHNKAVQAYQQVMGMQF